MADEPIPLRAAQVRVVRPDEVPRFNALLRAHHYLGFRKFCGHRPRHVSVHGERRADNMMSGSLRMLTHLVIESVVTNHQLREIPYGN